VKCVEMRSNDQHLTHTNTHTIHNLKDDLYKFEGHSSGNFSDSRRQGMLSQEWSLKRSYFLYSTLTSTAALYTTETRIQHIQGSHKTMPFADQPTLAHSAEAIS
jgi:hypothetical protein